MPSERETQAGISYFDVAEQLRALEREHHCRVHYTLGLPVRSTGRCALDVRICAKGAAYGARRADWERGRFRAWPTGECRTFAGLLYRLVDDLWKLLDEELAAAERETQGRLPLG